MDKENAVAKKIFFDYCCNHFLMFHNGESEKYKKYRINKRQEKVWRKEFIAHWISRLEPNDLTALHRLENAGAMEALSEIIFQADKGDGYAKLRYADAIWSIADIPWNFKRKQALVTAINLWKSLVEKPFEITEAHKADISGYLEILALKTAEEYVVTFAKRNLREKAKMR